MVNLEVEIEEVMVEAKVVSYAAQNVVNPVLMWKHLFVSNYF